MIHLSLAAQHMEPPRKRVALPIGRLLRPQTRSAHEKIGQLPQMREELATLKQKQADKPAARTSEELNELKLEIVRELLERNEEEYSRQFDEYVREHNEIYHSGKPYKGIVPSTGTCENYAINLAHKDAKTDQRLLDDEKRWRAQVDAEEKIRTLENRIEKVEHASALAVERFPGLGVCLQAIVPCIDVKSGLAFKIEKKVMRVWPEQPSVPAGVWVISEGPRRPVGCVDASTDEGVLEEFAHELRALLMEMAQMGPGVVPAWGKRFQMCVVCALPLDTVISRERGMGDTCWKRWSKKLPID